MRQVEILSPEQKEAGLVVYEDEDAVYLLHGKDILATWSSSGATLTSIQDVAQNTLIAVC